MMLRKMTCLKVLLIVTLTVGVSLSQSSLSNGLVGYWSFDAGTVDGMTVKDLSGQNDGTIEGDPQLVPGVYNEAMEFDGAGDQVVMEKTDAILLDNSDISIFFWFHPVDFQSRYMIGTFSSNNGRYYQAFTDDNVLRFSVDDDVIKSQVEVELEPNAWYHIGAVREKGKELRLYVDGELAASIPDETTGSIASDETLRIGNRAAGGRDFNSMLDEVRLYSRLLSQTEIQWIMANSSGDQASGPQPGDAATDVSRDTPLAWTPGAFANSHNIYLGTHFDDVMDASVENPLGVTVSVGRSENIYDPGRLLFDQTYFWRVDEVNSPPDSTVFKGRVWSFTTEPVAYPVTGVTAAASSEHDDAKLASKTIDGSGLNDNDEHSSNIDTMWLSSMAETEGVHITYDLGQVYKLHRVHVWNHNSQTERVLGYGIKEALIEVSTDGENWSELKTAELAQASASESYTGMEVSLDNAVAQFVRITALSNHSILGLKQFGLSEVRFYSIPVLAREPYPAHGSATAGVDVTLQWRSGREAELHEVVFGDDEQAVIDGSAVIGSVSEPLFALDTLDLGTSYFWRINEINDVETPPVYEGDLWSFQTPDQIMIDDFEMYRAQEGLRIWEHWIDGFDNPNVNGAVVGNGDDPETSIVYEGNQSMPLAYNNTTAPGSEATRTFDPPLDLAAGNPESIELTYRGLLYEFNGYYSVDGSTWNLMTWSPQYVVMSEDVLIGMAVTSHDTAQVTTAQFANVTTTGNVTGSWTQADIGGTHPNEDFTEVGGVFTIKASGADIWTTADEFRFVYKHLSGDGSITARADSLEHVHDWAKAGVMIRDTAVPEASFAMVAATPPGTQGVRYQARLEEAASAVSDSSMLDGSQHLMDPPAWIRVERRLANGAAPITMTLTDTSGKSATIETDDPAATQTTVWTALRAAPGDLDVNLSAIESITIGIGQSGVEGTIYVDAIRKITPYEQEGVED